MTTPNDGVRTLDNPFGQGPAWDRPADKVRQDLIDHTQRIRNRKELQPAAAKALIAQKYVATKQQLDDMRAAAPSDHAAKVADAKRRAFGIDDLTAGGSPADKATVAMSFRDAQQRAAQLGSPSQARGLFDTANQSGDELLTRAIGNRAMTDPFLGAQDVADDYLASHPGQQAAAEELNQLLTQAPDAATMFEYMIPKPPELSNLSDGQISDLAKQASTYQAGN